MKKFLILMTVMVLIIVFAGCETANNPPQVSPQPAENAFKDGVFEGEGDKWEYGSENATMTVENGKIKDIVLRRLDNEGKEVDYDSFKGQTVDGKTYPNLNEFRKSMADKMLEKQTYEVDIIAGATITTKNWKTAVQRALDKARQ